MHPLAVIIKRLKDTGILDAVICGKELQQRLIGLGGWCPWDGSNKTLFDDRLWEIRIKPARRSWWIAWCPRHGLQPRVFDSYPNKECADCEIVHVIENVR